MSTHLDFGIQLARQTGQLLLDFFHSPNLHTRFKKDHSVVTEADLAADRLIAAAIQQRYPNGTILSEELQPDFASPADEPHSVVWVVDPLDGTTNFSLGLHVWGVSLARTVDGWTETGVLYFPLIDELYYAQQGQGAYLNGKSIHVCTPEASSPQTFFACCSRTHQRFQVNLPYKARILGSAAYTFCAVGRGIAILGFEATPKIWDLAAAWLVVKEAGGEIETYDESRPFPLRSQVDYARANFPTLAAATPRLLEKARRQIVPR